MVVDILVAEGDRDDPLANQGGKRVDHLLGLPMIGEARRHPLDQPDRPVGLPQQHRPGIRRHRPAVERRNHSAAIKPFEFELSRIHSVCIGTSRTSLNLCRKRIIADSSPDAPPLVRYPG